MLASESLPTVLVVDDEPQVLAALADTLEDDFDVVAENSPIEAIKRLRGRPGLSVIISDQRMPGLAGHEFLSRAREISDAARILITGYSDMGAVVAAVNSGRIFGYISKPWDPEKLRQLIHQAADHCALLRALAEERRLLHSLLNNMPDAIYFKDRDRRFLRSNVAHARSLGFDDPSKLIGKTLAELLPTSHAALHGAEDARVLGTGLPVIDVPSLIEEGGQRRWLSTTIAPFRDDQEEVAGLVAISRDVTARRTAEEALQQAHDMLEQRVAERTADLSLANEKLSVAYGEMEIQAMNLAVTTTELAAARQVAEAASEAKSRFLATVSHELRTPLTGLIGMSELLLRDDLEAAEFRRFLELQRDAAHALHALVNDILDFSKIEANRLELESAPFQLRTILSGCEGLVAQTARAKGLNLQVVIDDSVDEWLLGDGARLRQIILNLLTNAIKFTNTGHVILTASAVGQGDGERRLRVAIVDTGIGIPADRVGHLFQPFIQVETSTSRRFGGTGLGLAICKQLVELMDGRIGVESSPGQGSEFWFEILVRSIVAPIPAPEQTRPLAGTTSARRILLAEDHPAIQLLVGTILRKAGHQVEIVGDGAAAVQAVADGAFDLVLMDSRMPVMDGLEATRRIRAAEADGPRLPIIALTANATEADIQQCLAAGMDLFVPKPLDKNLLLAKIASLDARFSKDDN